MKHLFYAAITFLLVLMPVVQIEAADDTRFANLVLYVSFADSGEDYWKGKEQEIYDIYNTTGRYTALSVKDYYSLVSCGKMELQNIMPQMSADASDNYIIVPITLENPVDYYSTEDSDYALIQECLGIVNSDSALLEKITGKLDYDGDGYIDSVTFLVASPAVERNSILYPHKGNCADYGLSIKGTNVNSYNVINYGSLSSASGGAGVVAHELMHVLGPLDTYRVCGENDGTCGEGPVGCWDIMAQTSAFVQYPLAYTRKELCWITIQEGSGSGSYTLTSPQADSNKYAMILKTPYSDTEFFVIEYRKQGSFYNEANIDKIDDKIGGSGIIVYRVNTAASPKSNLTGDYIYVFRNGETEATATTAKAREAYLSAESGRTSFGSREIEATTIDGAITYTDGTNSGIVISNVGSAGGDLISFDVEYSIDMTDKCWEKESYQPLEASYNSGIGLEAAFLNGVLYGSNVKTVFYNGTLYGLYSNKAGKAELLRYGNGQWESVKVLSQDYCYDVDFEVGKDGVLYIVTGAGDYSTITLYSMDETENITDITGFFTKSGSSVVNPKLATTSEGVVIAYRDYLSSDRIYMFLQKEGIWKEIRTEKTITGNCFQVCGSGNLIYLVTGHGNGNYVYGCNLGQTDILTEYTSPYTENESTAVDVFVDEYDTLYVSYYDTVRNGVLVQGYQDNSWKQVGMNVFHQMVSNIHALVAGDTIYVAYTGSEIQGIKSHKVLDSTGIKIEGVQLNHTTVNLSVGDTVVLQAILLPENTTQSKIIAWKSSDANVAKVDENGIVTGIEVGEAVITATAVNGVNASCTVAVKKVVPEKEKEPEESRGEESKEEETAAKEEAYKVGTKVTDTVSKATYKITGSNTVQYVAPKNGKNATEVTIPTSIIIKNQEYKVTSIGEKAFYNNKKIKTIKIPSSVTSIGKCAFYKCSKLKKVTIGKNVTVIGDKAFYKCTAMTGITIPSKVKKIGKQAFFGCKKLKAIKIETSRLTNKNVGSKAFSGIDKKATIKVPKKKWNAYKTLLKKKGVLKQAKIKKID